MRIGREHPLPTSTTGTASVMRNPSTGKGTNTLVPSPPPMLTIMTWNLATLGGGIGYPVARFDEVIAVIAKTIAHFQPDVCVILEVMRHARPPVEPKFYQPRSAGGLRNPFSVETRRTLRKLARELVEDLERPVPRRYEVRFLSAQFTIKKIADAYSARDNRTVNVDRMEVAIAEQFIHEVRRNTNRDMDEYFEGEFAGEDLKDVWASIPTKERAYVKQTDLRGDILEEYGAARWWQTPGKPYVKGMDPVAAKRELARYAVATRLHNLLIGIGHARFTRLLLLRRVPTEAEFVKAQPHYNRFRRDLEFDPDERARRLAAFDVAREAWERFAKRSSHPGVAELCRITEAVRKAAKSQDYVCWPASDDASKVQVDALTTSLSVSKGLDTVILYTENETYGILFNQKAVLLDEVTRLSGYVKRAPFAFRLHTTDGLPFNVIGYHAPSARPANAAARTASLVKLADAGHFVATCTGAATFTVGDFNVDTSFGYGQISDFSGSVTAGTLFSELAGDTSFPSASFFSRSKTTLKREPMLAEFASGDIAIGKQNFQSLASAFDKIVPYVPSCSGWALRYEALVPLYAMLADPNLVLDLEAAAVIEGATSLPWKLSVDGIKGALSKVRYVAPSKGLPSFVTLAHLIAQARLASDHLPILSVFTRPVGTSGSTVPSRMSFSPPTSRSIGGTMPKSQTGLAAAAASLGYTNCGGGDCLYHAVLHRWNPNGITIQGLRNQVANEVQNNPARYAGFLLAHQTIAGAVTAIGTMGSWNHFAGDLVPLAIANVLGMNLTIHFTNTGRDTHVAPVHPNGNLAPLNYNGYNHYW